MQNKSATLQYKHNAALAKYALENTKDSNRLLGELSHLFQEALKSTTEGQSVDSSNVCKCTFLQWYAFFSVYLFPIMLLKQRPTHFPRSCSTIGYNRAVLLYKQGQFASAASLLESLFRKGEFVHAWVAMRAGFLLLELYARTCESGTNEDNVRRKQCL